jgi:hypothetical protein
MGSAVGTPQVDDTLIVNISGVSGSFRIGSLTVDQMSCRINWGIQHHLLLDLQLLLILL